MLETDFHTDWPIYRFVFFKNLSTNVPLLTKNVSQLSAKLKSESRLTKDAQHPQKQKGKIRTHSEKMVK